MSGPRIRFAGRGSGRREGWWLKVYDAVLPLMWCAAAVGALIHPKLRASLGGRRGGVKSWRLGPEDDRPLLLVHVASRGEFEGARPLLDKLLAQGWCRVAVSLSSPSVAGAVASYPGLWAWGYIPLDFFDHQMRFLATLGPAAVVVMKHDLWPNTLRAAAALQIPVIVANANFHSRSLRGLPVVKSFHRAFMRDLTEVWAVSDADADRARGFVSSRTRVLAAGDTRYDRVLELAARSGDRWGGLRRALGGGPVVVAGSTWRPCEVLVWKAFAEVRRLHPRLSLAVVPHEPTPAAIRANLDLAHRHGLAATTLSEWEGGSSPGACLVVDRVGVLAELYGVGWAAYVGGGFGAGVHSVLEPAAFGLPTAFGPRHWVSHEAGLLLKSGGGFVVRRSEDLVQLWLRWLGEPESHRRAAEGARSVVIGNAGAAERMLKLLEPYLSGESPGGRAAGD